MANEIRVPDLGGAKDVEVIEILVKPGQEVKVEDGLAVLSSDKASMDLPSPAAGRIVEVKIKVGDKVSAGDLFGTIEGAPSVAPTVVVSSDVGARHAVPLPKEQPTAQPAPTDTDLSADLLVLGGGPGGYTAAFRAADLGLSVILVEKYAQLGGVCLNVGCIPSKALLHAARVLDEARSFAAHGITFGEPSIDLDKLRSWKSSVVERLTSGLSTMAKQRKVTVVQGVGTFSSPNVLSVETASGVQSVGFAQAILAAGSRVIEIPGIPWDDPRIWTSTGALELRSIPKRLLVVGGGIIGLEMATVYAGLGSKVTVVELTDGLIPGCDRDLVRPLERRMVKELGVVVKTKTKVSGIAAKKKELEATLEDAKGQAEVLGFDAALVSVGRRPNGDRLGLDKAGVAVTDRGFVPVDAALRTNVSHIFAIGDLVGQPMLAHKASHEGKVAAEVAAGERSAFDARVIPSVAYTDPEIAWVGVTETDAKAKGIAYEKGSFPWSASGRSLGMGREEGLTKLLFDPTTHRVIGGGVVGVNAGDLISEIGLAIEMGAEAGDIGLTVHPHPTLSETVAFAAEAFEGTLTDLYLPKRKKKG
jgi:dihydrolipoamide dehydrogenase